MSIVDKELAKKLGNKLPFVAKEGKEAITKNLAKKGDKIISTAADNILSGGLLNIGMSVFSGVGTYKDSRNEGKSVFASTVDAGLDFAKWELFGGFAMAEGIFKGVPKMAVAGVEGLNSMARSMNRASVPSAFHNATFNDNQRAATMRQNGMALAQASKYNLQQSLIGNEARYMRY